MWQCGDALNSCKKSAQIGDENLETMRNFRTFASSLRDTEAVAIKEKNCED